MERKEEAEEERAMNTGHDRLLDIEKYWNMAPTLRCRVKSRCWVLGMRRYW